MFHIHDRYQAQSRQGFFGSAWVELGPADHLLYETMITIVIGMELFIWKMDRCGTEDRLMKCAH